MEKAGYSILEVMVAFFVLAGVLMVSFSIFESEERGTLKLKNRMEAVRLCQKISEELHSKNPSNIPDHQKDVHFDNSFYPYLYSVTRQDYRDSRLDVKNLFKVSVQVFGPFDSQGHPTAQTVSVSLPALLARQPYP